MTQKTVRMSMSDHAPIDFPVYSPTLGNDVIDINRLGEAGLFTFDPGFMFTAACESKITFIDGEKGILLYRGYPIEQLAEKKDFLDVCYLLLNSELPNANEKTQFIHTINKHTMVHQQM